MCALMSMEEIKEPVAPKLELKEKGIKENLIQEALLGYPFDVQVEHAKNLAEKSIKKEKNISERALKQKLEQMLSRKGFPRDCLVMALEDVKIDKNDKKNGIPFAFMQKKLCGATIPKKAIEFHQKVKQALFRKGFPLELIDRYLAEISNDANK